MIKHCPHSHREWLRKVHLLLMMRLHPWKHTRRTQRHRQKHPGRGTPPHGLEAHPTLITSTTCRLWLKINTETDPCYRQARTVRIDRPPSPALTTTTIPSVGSCPWRSTLLPYKLRRNRKRPSPENRYQEPRKSAHHRTRRRRISLPETTSGPTEDSPRSRLRGSLRKSNDRKPMLPRGLFRRNANRIGTVRRASRNQARIYYIRRRAAIESAIPRGV